MRECATCCSSVVNAFLHCTLSDSNRLSTSVFYAIIQLTFYTLLIKLYEQQWIVWVNSRLVKNRLCHSCGYGCHC